MEEGERFILPHSDFLPFIARPEEHGGTVAENGNWGWVAV